MQDKHDIEEMVEGQIGLKWRNKNKFKIDPT